MKKKAKPRAVFLRGLDEKNHKWIKAEAKRLGYTLSGYINRVFEEARTQKW